jgi:ribosomal protein S18 acetylase RimI-like enzyme
MDVTIRQAKYDDVEALTMLAMASKQSNGYDDAFMTACADELRVTSASLDAYEYWVADSGTPCGFVSLEVDPDGLTGMIGSFFIAPGWQRRGIGRLLWSTVKELAQKKGLKVLRLDADPEAEAFYRGLGFSTVNRVPSGSIPGRTLPHMQIDLSA